MNYTKILYFKKIIWHFVHLLDYIKDVTKGNKNEYKKGKCIQVIIAVGGLRSQHNKIILVRCAPF